MRRLAMLLTAILFALPLPAQDTTMVLVPAYTLTPQQRQGANIQSARAWVGLGKEVGEAINSSLAAVTEQTSKFAETKVGTLTIALVVWRVMGRDVVGIVLGSLLFICVFPVILWSMRKYLPITIDTKLTYDEKGKVNGRERKVYEGDWSLAMVHFLFMVILVGVCAIIVFA